MKKNNAAAQVVRPAPEEQLFAIFAPLRLCVKIWPPQSPEGGVNNPDSIGLCVIPFAALREKSNAMAQVVRPAPD